MLTETRMRPDISHVSGEMFAENAVTWSIGRHLIEVPGRFGIRKFQSGVVGVLVRRCGDVMVRMSPK
jgi:hypothetical protein